MNKQIIIYLTLGILLFSCKIKKETKAEPVKTDPVVEVNSKEEIDLDQLKGSYYIISMETFPELNGVVPSIKIEETGSISGNNGCNTFSGQLNDEEGDLIQNIGSTRKACQGETDDVERAMMETLKQLTDIKSDGRIIKFYSDDRVIMTGKKLSLEMGNWQVVSIEGKEYGQMPSFEVNNNRMNGNTGCNSFFGMVQQNGFSLKIIEPGATEMVCPDFDMAMESKFIQSLGKVTEFKKEGRVVIFSHQGKELFRASNPEQE
jgi:heat shock protein HslJ